MIFAPDIPLLSEKLRFRLFGLVVSVVSHQSSANYDKHKPNRRPCAAELIPLQQIIQCVYNQYNQTHDTHQQTDGMFALVYHFDNSTFSVPPHCAVPVLLCGAQFCNQCIYLRFEQCDHHLLPRFFPHLEIARQRVHFQLLRRAHFGHGIQ